MLQRGDLLQNRIAWEDCEVVSSNSVVLGLGLEVCITMSFWVRFWKPTDHSEGGGKKMFF